MILNVFDTETTGTHDREPFLSSPELGPEIVEYALVRWNDGLATPVLHKIIRPNNWRDTCKLDEDGTVRTLDGFPLAFREDTWNAGRAITWNRSDDQFMHRELPVAPVLGSNPAFDLRCVSWELSRDGAAQLPYIRRVDTSSLGVYLLFQGLVDGTGLGKLAKFFGVEHEEHTAMGDVMATIGVLEKFIDQHVYLPRIYREALEVIREASPDPDMAEFAARALRGEEQES